MRTLLIANPSADVYGSDLQMLETVRAIVDRGWQVVVLTPTDGPLVEPLRALGATVRFEQYPVLRRAFASPIGLLRLAVAAGRSTVRLRRLVRDIDPCVVYVNTTTLPWWLFAARLARVPVVCHVHEAESADGRLVRTALTAPLLLASEVIVNGAPARRVAVEVVPRLDSKVTVVENGVAPPPEPVPDPPAAGPVRLAVIGRLSPRKATMTALDATGMLRSAGRDIVVEVCGSAFPGYEWYSDSLDERADRPDLVGGVTFAGYVDDVWGALARAHVLLAPSLGESMGNAVIQAQLARRAVVATDVQGHTESVVDGVTGLLVPVCDAEAMAAAVASLLDDPARRGSLVEAAYERTSARFAIGRYDDEVVAVLARWCDRHGAN